MHRLVLASLRPSLSIVVPALLVTGCPDDGTSADGTSTESSGASESPEGSSSGVDPDTSAGPSSTTVDPDSSSSTDPGESTGDPCGDGGIDGDEECDGAELVGRSCESLGFPGGLLTCTPECTLDTSECLPSVCGDGEIHVPEECDGEALDTEDCVSQGFDDGELGCDVDCTFDTSACVTFGCGNDVVEGDELCDGADLDGADCGSQGLDGGILACAASCRAFDTAGCYVCGDGELNVNEDCEGDIGGATCVGLGFDGGVLACGNDCQYDTSGCFGCGDGVLGGDEICDGSDFGALGCTSQGFDGGAATCAADCGTISYDSCFGLHQFCSDSAAAIGPAAGTLTVDTIDVAGLAGSISDVDVIVDGTHTAVGHLEMSVRYVETDTAVVLADEQCGTADNFDATFDQSAAAPPACGAPAFSGNVLPLGDLDAFASGETDGNGTWELTILDQTNGDGGTLAQWCVAITTAASSGSLVTVRTGDGMLRALDPETLEFTDIGPLGVEFDFGEVAWDGASNTMWMIDGRPLEALYTVDIATGAATFVGQHLVTDLFGLAVDPTSGVLYGSSLAPNGFHEMDRATGSASFIGNPGINADGLTYDTARNQIVALEGGLGRMFTIDPDTAVTNVLSTEGFVNNCGLAYEPIGDLLWAIDWSGEVYTYDPNDGYTRTLMASVGEAHDGLTFVPGLLQ